MKSPAGGNSDAQMLAFSTSGHHLLVVVIPEKAGIIDNRGGQGSFIAIAWRRKNYYLLASFWAGWYGSFENSWLDRWGGVPSHEPEPQATHRLPDEVVGWGSESCG